MTGDVQRPDRAAFVALAHRWSGVYQRYIAVSDFVMGAPRVNVAAVQDMARASTDVAAVWRAMLATEEPLPWWCRAALGSAAEAFEDLGREWARKVPRPGPSGPGDGVSDQDGRWPDGV